MESRAPPKTKKEIRDESIMGTNNSSIVSKRSVERLYHPEPHFFRHFVKKPQRRSPLINRGYWLRMHAVDHVIKQFLKEPSERDKVVINLGCGYDPLPFQCLTRYPKLCQNVKFVDVDYMELIRRKCEVIEQTDSLRQLLTNLKVSTSGETITLRSDHYVAVGCDLRAVEKLQGALAEEFDLENCLVLCTAEVSVTYMDVHSADALIKWAATLSNARFCLLEQFLPDGPEHPFAKAMTQHFEKLQTPLRCINKYPSLQHQRQRFLDLGWDQVAVSSLWDLWRDSRSLSYEDRVALNDVEPFDEWEEFALFASHYFVAVAVKITDLEVPVEYIGPYRSNLTVHLPEDEAPEAVTPPRGPLVLQYQDTPKGRGRRRFGAAIGLTERSVGHHGGLGPQSRLNSTDVYSNGKTENAVWPTPPVSVAARMCHTVTLLDGSSFLLVGGRTSPGNALGDCWLRLRESWEQVHDLPLPRYRHCATGLYSTTPGVLVCGGKSSEGVVLADYFIWRADFGWQEVQVIGVAPRPRFGASMITSAGTSGILLGGMSEEGIVLSDSWHWFVDLHAETVTIRFQQVKLLSHSFDGFATRFGASLQPTELGVLLIGGIADRGLLAQESEVVYLRPDQPASLKSGNELWGTIYMERVDLGCAGPRPLLVGHSVITVDSDILIFGGGAVCFSFGTHWNTGIWTLRDSKDLSGPKWHLCDVPQAILPTGSKLPFMQLNGNGDQSLINLQAKAIGRVHVASRQGFQEIVTKGKPVIIEGLNIGSCTRAWTIDYLRAAVGASRPVVVHESTADQMNFQAKNFAYVTKPFGEFLDQVTKGHKQYLRSIASEKPAETPAELSRDFPQLAEDFILPPELALVKENAHSSPLRISGPVSLWLHYDVMANVLCQIRGTKRLILYPPSDVTRLHFPAGASSSILSHVGPTHDNNLHPASTHPYEAILHPGDVLFTPPCWPHTAAPIDSVSIAVNVFFRSVRSGYAAGKDVYGNRDLQAYEKGRLDVAKMAKSFERLPTDMAKFYLERLAEELMEKAGRLGSSE